MLSAQLLMFNSTGRYLWMYEIAELLQHTQQAGVLSRCFIVQLAPLSVMMPQYHPCNLWQAAMDLQWVVIVFYITPRTNTLRIGAHGQKSIWFMALFIKCTSSNMIVQLIFLTKSWTHCHAEWTADRSMANSTLQTGAVQCGPTSINVEQHLQWGMHFHETNMPINNVTQQGCEWGF